MVPMEGLVAKPEICLEASSGMVNSSLYKSWSQGLRLGHNGGGGGVNFLNLYPIYKQLFWIFLRTALLNMWCDFNIILLEKGLLF